MKPFEAARHLLPDTPWSAAPAGEARAPANIALCKYWGKRDPALNLPVTSSLSVSLGQLGAHTRIEPAERDVVSLDGMPLESGDPFAARVSAYLDLFRWSPELAWRVETSSSVPVGAGLASSASGFAALVLALDRLYGWQLPTRRLSILARLGSGSASRSVCPGFVEWHAGSREDGMDSFAERLDADWPSFRIGLLVLSRTPKPIGSREGMNRTTATSGLYAAWPDMVARHLEEIREAIRDRDLPRLGEAAEANALAMHATMIAARPPVLYWTKDSLATMQQVWARRADGLPVFLTMDAGPNVKLLYEEASAGAVREAFPELQEVGPFRERAG